MGNKGKKYVKLRGDEVAKPENLKRANDFMAWYGANAARLHARNNCFDHDVATDSALKVYDAIALRGAKVVDFKSYYLRVYHTELLGQSMRGYKFVELPDNNRVANFTESVLARVGAMEEVERLRMNVARYVSDDDARLEYEYEVERLRLDILDYVRSAYNCEAVSLFEIYTSLAPEITYKTLAKMLGISDSRVWPVLGAMRKDVANRFRDRRNNILSL